MSTPRKIDAKAAAKRRAARRKQTRETLGRLGIIAIVAILVIGTVASVIIPGVATAPGAVGVPTEAPTVNPTATQADLSGLQAIVQQGDQSASRGDWTGAASLYRAYLAQDPTNGEVHFKLGKAYLSLQPPHYLEALAELQQALNINPSAPYAQEAQSLIDQYEDDALTPAAVITGTVTTLPGSITGTVTVTNTGTLTSTAVVTGTSTTGTAPPTAPPPRG
ncbi:MAG TPA: tetratricopeptide repeat protein, partial [Chloroflexia bacterium]